MSSGQRKLSFLGFAPQGEAAPDELQLDEEMQRVVWGEPTGGPPGGAGGPPGGGGGAPLRDDAAPPPYEPRARDGAASGAASATDTATSEPQAAAAGDERHVQFGARGEPLAEPLDEPRDEAERERRTQRLAWQAARAPPPAAPAAPAAPPAPAAPAAPPPASDDDEGGSADEAERGELRAHRTDDPRALRRHLIEPRGSTVHVSRKDGGENIERLLADAAASARKTYDHSPHSVFVQLDELLSAAGGEAEWQETARWIKYEEDVEAGAGRWGRPHVASLSFHSLLNLRRCLETGVVLLDLDEKDLPGVAYRVAESMVAAGLLAEDDQPVVLRSLLLRHKHVHDERGFRFSVSSAARRRASGASLQSLWGYQEAGAARVRCSLCAASGAASGAANGAASARACRRHSMGARSPPPSLDAKRRRSSYVLPAALAGGVERNKSAAAALDPRELAALAAAAATAAGSSQEELRRAQPHDSILRRIPDGAEATTVLVGAVGFLRQPTIAFVRLAHGIHMPSITEVPVPVRFMFVLLGPADAELDYHEVGRSISTLMANPSFHGIAYRAEDRRDLLSAINEFLDDSIVLPPGDWERQALLPVDELRAKSDMIRRRKRDALERRRRASLAAPDKPDRPDRPAPGEKQALLAAEVDADRDPSKQPDDPLRRTGRLFGGVVRDMRRRYPHYASDFRDALNGQCAAAAIFMYFAALSSAITFGGLLADKTDRQIGISETLVFTMAGGVVFALVAGQPLMITGATGPLLLLDASLADFCRAYGFHFLAARMYAGLWMLLIALAVASVEGSVAVKKITRFTEDIFAFLISLIFISEPVSSLVAVYRAHPLSADYCAPAAAPSRGGSHAGNATAGAGGAAGGAGCALGDEPPYPNTALFCTMLTLATFIIAYYLRIFRNGKFLGRSARRALGDFGVPIAIVAMVGVAACVPVRTETLRVPAGLSPTAPRAWLVPLNPGLDTIPFWAALAMALPALMVYIIVFMETHIAELIIAKPERRLAKGSGFHMDVVVMSAVNAACGLFGAPWQCVATVRSVSHVAALTVMSTTHAPGDKPHVVEVKEQRVTGLVVSVLVGLSVAAAGWLQRVPMAVLFGVFLYMGVSALATIQMWERCVLLFKPVKHHPQVPYVRRVPTLRMHLYTLVQVAGLAVLVAVKSSRISLALPFFLVLMVPLRMALGHVFTPLQLRALDGAQPDAGRDDEPDFYEEAPLPG